MTKPNSAAIQINPDGSTEAANPDTLTAEQLVALGHRKRPLTNAIREKCIDCCAGQTAEVRRCTTIKCALWPYRMATDPFAIRRGPGKAFSCKNSRQIGRKISAEPVAPRDEPSKKAA